MVLEYILVPDERIGVLIGKRGQTKQKIEQKTLTKLKIDSREGEVEISAKEPDNGFFKAKEIIRAIGRGFSPERAFRLFEPEVFLSVIELSDVASTKKKLANKRARVIGTKGRAREQIEQESGASICVFGKTISIIGKAQEIEKARKAVEMLLEGAEHKKVFNLLKTQSKKFEL